MTAKHLRLVLESVLLSTVPRRISPERRSLLTSSLCCVWDVLLLCRSLVGACGASCVGILFGG